MSRLFTGYIIARREIRKVRRLFVDSTIEIACMPIILMADSGAEAKAIAYAELIQRLPASDGWDEHDAQMFEVSRETLQIAMDAMNGES